MRFEETGLSGAFIIEPEILRDERGFFARTFCVKEFEALGLDTRLVQCNVSLNHRRGTLRGMHYQVTPRGETKLVRCTRGAIHDVIVDLRNDSPTFGRWTAVTLSARNYRMLYIPRGFAHGFQTLEDASEVFYQMSEFHTPECARGLRWDDPTLRIFWPLAPTVISQRDRVLPTFRAATHHDAASP